MLSASCSVSDHKANCISATYNRTPLNPGRKPNLGSSGCWHCKSGTCVSRQDPGQAQGQANGCKDKLSCLRWLTLQDRSIRKQMLQALSQGKLQVQNMTLMLIRLRHSLSSACPKHLPSRDNIVWKRKYKLSYYAVSDMLRWPRPSPCRYLFFISARFSMLCT